MLTVLFSIRARCELLWLSDHLGQVLQGIIPSLHPSASPWLFSTLVIFTAPLLSSSGEHGWQRVLLLGLAGQHN